MSDLKTYSEEEISQHRTKSDLWLVIHGKGGLQANKSLVTLSDW